MEGGKVTAQKNTVAGNAFDFRDASSIPDNLTLGYKVLIRYDCEANTFNTGVRFLTPDGKDIGEYQQLYSPNTDYIIEISTAFMSSSSATVGPFTSADNVLASDTVTCIICWNYEKSFIDIPKKLDTFLDAYLINRIGYSELSSEIQSFWFEVIDSFYDSSEYRLTRGVTRSKNGNTIAITTTANSAFSTYDVMLEDGHKYVIYYDITGYYTGGNYAAEFRLGINAWTKVNIGGFSQTSGASTAGSIVVSVEEGEGGYLGLNIPNKTGEQITGDIFVYDVTDLTDSEINTIDFSAVGRYKLELKGTGSGSSVTSWNDKKVVFYGDSITLGQYPAMVQVKLGFELVVKAIGGTRFVYGNNADNFSSDTRIAGIPSDADVVCIMGGTNDWQWSLIEDTLTYDNGFDRSKFKGAVAYTVQKIQVQCPNARIFLLTNIGGRGESAGTVQPLPIVAPSGDGVGNTPLKIRDATIEVANTLNIPVIDTWSCGINGFNRTNYISDTVHPNTDGSKLIAEYIVNALVNNAGW